MKLGGILGIAGAVVAIVAAVASGGTLAWLAAGMLTLNAATSVGLIGGSVGKFMQSGAGRALTLAAGAAAAYGAFTAGATAADVGTAQAAQSASAASPEMAATAQSAAGSAAAGGAQAASGGMTASLGSQGFSLQDAIMPPNVAGSAAGAGTNAAAWSMASPDMLGASGVNGASMAQNSAQELNAANAAVVPNASANTTAEQLGQKTAFPGEQAAGGGGPNLTAGPAQAQSAVVPGETAAGTAPIGQADTTLEGAQNASRFTGVNPSGATTPATAAATPAAGGGFMNTLMNTKGGAGLLQGAAGAIGGIGQGISQKQAMEDQLKAMQWANMQWGNQGQVANVNNAAAMPINVPGGYLQRAQAIRNLVSTNPFVPPAPTPVPGVPPPARPV